MSKKQIYYSDKYTDEEFEYSVPFLHRHVMLPKQLSKLVPTSHLMTEDEWRGLGVQQSQGWIHYMIHKPEPHILLFRRPLPKD
uniref:Cyclin-dependent kinases regulatory subunit n=1 Tax=Esox lucius TaxID=8010 RepID=A0A3P8YMN7_ESOLU